MKKIWLLLIAVCCIDSGICSFWRNRSGSGKARQDGKSRQSARTGQDFLQNLSCRFFLPASPGPSAGEGQRAGLLHGLPSTGHAGYGKEKCFFHAHPYGAFASKGKAGLPGLSSMAAGKELWIDRA